ncbi:xylulose kinase [Galendromus occidentalis]|uniref:Xylulose kinase n=1 Tax=Galendromus occidentalis TaxID=34638 RepID=A0AAJ6QWW4_9ACAR|nr:xylulose kinase [Galendromus occidentalis]
MFPPTAGMACYLGLDLSTQQLKGIVVCSEPSGSESNYRIVCEDRVVFDDLNFGTTSGAIVDGNRARAPVKMWLRAVDMILESLSKKIDLHKIRCIGGCGQQHGTVFWRDPSLLHRMDPSKSLEDNLRNAFSIELSPIWMDSSTTAQCLKLEAHVGGALELAHLTGSRAYERFSGNQIAKIATEMTEDYEETARISLVSSFIPSLFLGEVAPIDFSDGSGMNLMNIRTNTWSQKCLDGCLSPDRAEELFNKLGGDRGLVAPGADLGGVCSTICSRFGFSPECRVSAFSGDNPASFVGMGVSKGDIVISLGSSDTLLLWVDKSTPPLLQGHLLANPIDPEYLMGMLCFKNGSLMRDRIAEECAGGDWQVFNALLDSTPAGNNGRVGVYFDFMEILPPRQGRLRFDLCGRTPVQVHSPFDNAGEIRALIEGQFMSKRIYAERVGFKLEASSRLLVTGGASANAALCQILADVFDLKVYSLTVANSAALGGAILAQRCIEGAASIEPLSQLVAVPQKANVYVELLPKFRKCLEHFDLL